MKLDPKVGERLSFYDAARRATCTQLDHFPPLIINTCLDGAEADLAKFTPAFFASDRRRFSETITMPRRGFGLRPIHLLSPVARTLYEATVAGMAPSLSTATRGPGKWDLHRGFGMDGVASYVVEIDIASYYEFIDHEILGNELTLRTMDVGLTSTLLGTLNEVAIHGRGLPQMLDSSDLLADTYMSILDRQMARDGSVLSRFADDIRLLASSWEIANQAIERVAEYARELGLLLSSQKTKILRLDTLKSTDAEEQRFVEKYAKEAKDSLTLSVWMRSGDYGDDVEEIKIEPDDREALRYSSRRILDDWLKLVAPHRGENAPDVPGPMSRFLRQAMTVLMDDEEPLLSTILDELVFRDPLFIEQVCTYIIYRSEQQNFADEDHWARLRMLTGLGRQSPWAKLWMLYCLEKLPLKPTRSTQPVLRWAVRQVDDRHEVVRTQAAWALACRDKFPAPAIGALHNSMTSISQAALAAIAVRQASVSKVVRDAVTTGSVLCRKASEWASG